jgi:putative transposase
VLPADVPDAEAADEVLDELIARYPTVQIVWVDSAYDRTALLQWALEKWERLVVPVRRPEGVSGWVLLPKRWLVERSFGWLGGYRRLSKDYEQLVSVSEAWIGLAFMVLLVRRLTRQNS